MPPAGRRQHHNLIDFLLWYPKFPVRIGSRNFDHCHSFHSLFPPPAAVVSLPLILCHEVRIRRRVVRIGEIMPRGRSMSAPTVTPGVRWRRGGFRDGRPVPYERTGDCAGLPLGGCYDYPSVSFADSSPDKGSLGAERIRRRCGGGWEIVLRQSLRLPVRADTSLYTREARGAAAPEEGFGCGGGRRLCGRSMIAPTYTTGNVTNSHCFSAKSNLFSHGTGNPSPTFSIATELCNFELKYRR